MVKYIFREGPIFIRNAAKADVQAIGEALEKLKARNGGELKPKALVDDARSSRHPAHHQFEWNDKVAGEAHRLHQARELISIVRGGGR
jgi:hypothetical protein